MASPLTSATAPELALRHIVATCRDDLVKHRAVVLKSGRPAGIHQTRVALRRMRAAFSLFRNAAASEISAREMKALAGEAKWLAGECAPSRDLHVFLTETTGDVPASISRVAKRLARIHLERARIALSSARFDTFEASLSGFIDHVPNPLTGRLDSFGRAMLDKRARKVAKRGHKLASLDGERLHELRIAIKKLRYAATFLRPAFASRAGKSYIEATVRLQGALGSLNDHAVAAQMLADIEAAARSNENIGRVLAKLAKQAASGDKRRRRRLKKAWQQFEKAERFWRG